jgi:hypothetical protein
MMNFYYLHIPKTAGTTFTAYLDKHFADNEIFPYKVWDEVLEDIHSRPDLSNYKLVRGHFGYGMYRYYDTPPLTITILRDPVERVISLFHHIKLESENYRNMEKHGSRKYSHFVDDSHLEFINKETTFEEALEHPELRDLFSNGQTKHIGKDLDIYHRAQIGNIVPSEFSLSIDSEFRKLEDQEQLYRDALENLYTLSFVGVQEDMEKNLKRMRKKWKFFTKPTKIDRLMTFPNRPKREDFSESVIKKLEKLHELDFAIYEEAKKIIRKESRFIFGFLFLITVLTTKLSIISTGSLNIV